ncbi:MULTISPECIES: energy transducer TonB family protein [Kordiimonas]|jgi:TonB family protein|uniref:energy transducer TonB family protein n=1 Tax=Kordiimonas TaxID=288021 RepID=UPI002581112F|nr:energy transducer TonB [Kordiimonas sp. UBA4487]
MKKTVTTVLAASLFCGAAFGDNAPLQGPKITEFDAEIGKWAARAGRSGCAHVQYKLNDEGDVYGVKLLGSKGHKSFAREAKYGVRGMSVEAGSAPAGTYDLVVDFVITRRSASNAEQATDAFERNPKVCPYTAKTDHEPIVVSAQRQYRAVRKQCDATGVGSNMKTC